MKLLLPTIACCASLACTAQNNHDTIAIPMADTGKPAAREAIATFAEGCFWHSEIIFQSLEGVRDAVPGFAGGTQENPDFKVVATGKSGYAETVQVYYDPSKITYQTLVRAFFASHDPTTLNRQGNDEGSQYRSVAFYRTPEEKAVLESEMGKLNRSGIYKDKIVTEVVPYTLFYPAKDKHQEYVSKHPESPYVQQVCMPAFQKFKATFKGNFK